MIRTITRWHLIILLFAGLAVSTQGIAEQIDITFIVAGKTSNHRQFEDGSVKVLNFHFFAEIFLQADGKVSPSHLVTPLSEGGFENSGYALEMHGGRYRTEQALEQFELDGRVLTAGSEGHYYQDDQEYPFRSSHHFRHHCPLEGEAHAIVLSPSKKPILFHYCPEDFWYEHQPVGEPFWIDCFEVRPFSSKESIWKALAQYKSFAYLGPDNEQAREQGFEPVSESFQHHLNWHRAYKSAYEVYCVEQATEIAVRGHMAARTMFLEGGSEFDIHMAYLMATGMKDRDLPYTAIVGVDEKAAVLHYAQKRHEPRNGRLMLIDSGANYNGYASDITRTHVSGEAGDEFNSVLDAMNRAQLDLCDSITSGMNFGELFHESHRGVGRVLLEHGILTGLSLEEAIDNELTHVFYPHGVSHMLGIHVHDVGSKQLDLAGTFYEKDKKQPTRTVMRPIEAGHLFTVEPGLYFIEMLLNPHRQGPHKNSFNWQLIDRLTPLGGIRVEDNIHVGDDGVRNITRQYLP